MCGYILEVLWQRLNSTHMVYLPNNECITYLAIKFAIHFLNHFESISDERRPHYISSCFSRGDTKHVNIEIKIREWIKQYRRHKKRTKTTSKNKDQTEIRDR